MGVVSHFAESPAQGSHNAAFLAAPPLLFVEVTP